MTLKEGSSKILVGEDYKQWQDTYVLSLINSLKAKAVGPCKYYFQVFNQIIKKVDGFIFEAIGSVALAFVKNHTEEFSNLVSRINSTSVTNVGLLCRN